MKHVLDINRQTTLSFVKKARQFLNLPRNLFECDIEKCNPELYKGSRGASAVRRAKKGLEIVDRVDGDLKKLCALLERKNEKTDKK